MPVCKSACVLSLCATGLSMFGAGVFAGNSGFYDPQRMSDMDRQVFSWFQEAPVRSCCGEADAFEADDFDQKDGHFVAIVTDGKPNNWRPGLPEGTRIQVPNAQIRWTPRNPTGHGVLFIRRGWNSADPSSIIVFCYFPPSGI